MSRRFLAVVGVLSAIVAGVWLSPVRAAGQATTAAEKRPAATQPAARIPPRTSRGDPDLQGIWNNTAMIGVPLEAQDEQTLRERLTGSSEEASVGPPSHCVEGDRTGSAKVVPRSLFVDPPAGKLPPLTLEAQKRWKAKAEARRGIGTDQPRPGHWVEDVHLWVRCITRGVPDSIFPRAYNNNYQIMQTPEYVVILYEMIHDARIIPLGGRPHLPDTVRQWMGDSRGRWEGTTLVVDTTNFTDKIEGNLIPNGGGGFGSGTYRGAGETLHLVERFTRVDADTIDYQATIDDPKLYTRPWTVAFRLTTQDSPDRILEYACHEGNYGLAHILSAAAARDQAAEEVAKRK